MRILDAIAPPMGLRERRTTLRFLLVLLLANLALSTVLWINEWRDSFRGGTQQVDLKEWLTLVAFLFSPFLAVGILRTARLNRQLSAQMLLAEAVLDDVVAASREWIWTADSRGRITSSNQAVRPILGYDPEELVGTDFLTLVRERDREDVAERMAAHRDKKEGWSGWLVCWTHLDGSYRWVETTGTPILDQKGSLVVGHRGSGLDVTERVFRKTMAEAAVAEHEERTSIIRTYLEDPAQLEMVFQPIVTVDDRRVVGAEALARFKGRPPRPPNELFGEAAEVGLDVELELLAVRRAIEAVANLPDGTYLSLNTSPRTFADPSFLLLLLEPHVPTSRLVVEMTEHASVTNYELMRGVLDKVRRLGVRIAVDDAGAGYSNLHHILNMQPDIIKLDRALTRDVDRDPVRRALASAMVVFSNEIGATLVAEGVERREELDVLRSAGVKYVQGYLLGTPSPLPFKLNGHSAA